MEIAMETPDSDMGALLQKLADARNCFYRILDEVSEKRKQMQIKAYPRQKADTAPARLEPLSKDEEIEQCRKNLRSWQMSCLHGRIGLPEFDGLCRDLPIGSVSYRKTILAIKSARTELGLAAPELPQKSVSAVYMRHLIATIENKKEVSADEREQQRLQSAADALEDVLKYFAKKSALPQSEKFLINH